MDIETILFFLFSLGAGIACIAFGASFKADLQSKSRAAFGILGSLFLIPAILIIFSQFDSIIINNSMVLCVGLLSLLLTSLFYYILNKIMDEDFSYMLYWAIFVVLTIALIICIYTYISNYPFMRNFDPTFMVPHSGT